MRVVLAHGCFDVLHYGHLQHFKSAKKHGDYLVVSVTSAKYVNKGEGRPIFSDQQRMEMLKSLRIVDQVVLSDAPTPEKVIKQWKPHVYAKGPDYDPSTLPEKVLVEKFGGKVVFTQDQKYSSTELCSTLLNQ